MPQAAPSSGVFALPQKDRRLSSRWPGCSSGDGQLRDAQDPQGGKVVQVTSALPSALHAHLSLMAQSGGTMVCQDH